MRVSILIWFFGAVLGAACVGAPPPDLSKADLGAIVQRNVFGLKPMPATAVAPSTPAEPAAQKVILTGITTILGNKTALLKTELPPEKPGSKPQQQFLVLAEGEREGNIGLLKVDEKAGTATVDNDGTTSTITFPQPTSAPSPAVSAAHPPPAANATTGGHGRRTISTRFGEGELPEANLLPQ